VNKKAIPAEVLEFFRKQGKRGGKLSGKARMVKLTPEQRSAIAKKAAAKSAEVRSKKAAAKKKAGKKSRKLDSMLALAKIGK
jgi:hypothetical protein